MPRSPCPFFESRPPARADALTRTRREVVLPLSTPIRGRDGREIREIVVPNDTVVVVGILAANRNKAVWGADVMEWWPERWLKPLPESVMEARVPGVYSHL